MVSEKAGKETKVVGSNLIYSTNRLAQVWANQKCSDKLTTKARNFTRFMHVVHKARNFTWFMHVVHAHRNCIQNLGFSNLEPHIA